VFARQPLWFLVHIVQPFEQVGHSLHRVDHTKGILYIDHNEDNCKNVGLIGGGLFAKNVLMPALMRIGRVNLVGVSTTRGITCDHIASKFGFTYATSDYSELLKDASMGSVFIITRHNLHCEMVTAALKAGKDVFVEKPLCLAREELAKIMEAYKDSKATLMVGFNRRYSRHALCPFGRAERTRG
jgi:predicted dehydrogenase